MRIFWNNKECGEYSPSLISLPEWRIFSLAISLPPSLSHAHINTPIHALSLSLALSLSPPPSLTCARARALSHVLSLSRARVLAQTHSLSHVRTPSHAVSPEHCLARNSITTLQIRRMCVPCLTHVCATCLMYVCDMPHSHR